MVSLHDLLSFGSGPSLHRRRSGESSRRSRSRTSRYDPALVAVNGVELLPVFTVPVIVSPSTFAVY